MTGKPTLVDRIAKRIASIPAHNPGVMSLLPNDMQTLGRVLDSALIHRIAVEAAKEIDQERDK